MSFFCLRCPAPFLHPAPSSTASDTIRHPIQLQLPSGTTSYLRGIYTILFFTARRTVVRRRLCFHFVCPQGGGGAGRGTYPTMHCKTFPQCGPIPHSSPPASPPGPVPTHPLTPPHTPHCTPYARPRSIRPAPPNPIPIVFFFTTPPPLSPHGQKKNFLFRIFFFLNFFFFGKRRGARAVRLLRSRRRTVLFGLFSYFPPEFGKSMGKNIDLHFLQSDRKSALFHFAQNQRLNCHYFNGLISGFRPTLGNLKKKSVLKKKV